MKNIKVHQHYYDIQALYKKANTKTQRSLLGYMVKGGFASDPIYGGAFALVSEIEKYAGIYILGSKEDPKTTMQIIGIAEDAMLGKWDDLAFSEREINTILIQLGNLQGKGGK